MACAPLRRRSEVAAEATSTAMGPVWCLLLASRATGGQAHSIAWPCFPASFSCFPVVYVPMPRATHAHTSAMGHAGKAMVTGEANQWEAGPGGALSSS